MKKILLFALLTLAMAFRATAATGDVNNDGEVNISDVNALIDMILSEDGDDAGDVNGDAEVNISDVNALIDIILSGGVVDEITPKEIELDFSALKGLRSSRTMKTRRTMVTMSRTRHGLPRCASTSTEKRLQ